MEVERPQMRVSGGSRGAEEEGAARKRRRKMEYDSNDVAANCYIATPEFLKSFVDSSSSGRDGALFGFAADMEGVASIPKKIFLQMTGVLQVLHSEDDIADILEDSTVRVQTVSKKNTTVRSATVVCQKHGGTGKISELLRAPAVDYRGIVQSMEDVASGDANVQLYFGGEGGARTEPMRHAKLFLSTHRVEYSCEESGESGIKQAMVLWVYCAKHFDFVGKMSRMYSNQDSWRKHRNTKEAERRASVLERQYENWKEILLGLVTALRLPKVWRGLEMRVGMDPFENLLSDLHPESFYSMTNPVAVYNSICWMCPDDASVRVEGMDYSVLDNCGLTPLQYLYRYIAFRKQFLAMKKEQMKASKKAAAGGEEDEDEGEDVSAEAGEGEEEEEGGAGSSVERFSGHDAGFVRGVLQNKNADFFDEGGAAMHVEVLGWPSVYSTENNLVYGLPETSVVAYLDFGTMVGELGGIVSESAEWLQARFGDFPMRLRWRINNGMMECGEEGLSEAAFLPPSFCMEETKRRKRFSRVNNPLMGYIFDMVYSKHTATFFREVVLRSDRIRMYALYVKSMQNHLRSDLLAGKARSVVLLSTQTYVDSKEFEIAGETMDVMREWREERTGSCLSDFETYLGVYHSIMNSCNNTYWGLTGRNMFLLMNLNASETLWRCGTSGNWKWIGMPVNVIDGAGLTVAKNGTNLKKSGTCGFDYTRNIRDSLRRLYEVSVYVSVLEQFKNGDGQISSSTMRMTPGSVGEGLIQIVDNKIIDEPDENKMGTMVILPEGLGDRECVENCVKFTPRDDKVDVQMETTVDLGKTGMRQKLIRKGVAGMTLCLCAFARNQQPVDIEMVHRMEDLSRVCTLVPSSGREDVETNDILVENEYDKRLPWYNRGVSAGRASTIIGNTASMSVADKQKYASFFSMVPMVTALVCLQQKTGIVSWNVAPDVAFVLRETQGWFVGLANVLLSNLKIDHSSRFFDSAVSMAGVSQTVLIRTYAEMAVAARTGSSVHESINRVTQLQTEDALHYSLVPGVLMRFLTGMLDYPVLWVLSAMFREVQMPVIDLMSAVELLGGGPVTNSEDRATVKQYLQRSLRDNALCRASEFEDVRETTNVMMYVTSRGGVDARSAMRTKFNPAEAQNRELKKLVQEKLLKNASDVFEQDAKNYGMFCVDNHELCISHAITKLLRNDFNLSALLGGGAVFYDHKAWVANVVGEGPGPKFKGVPLMHPGEFNLLRVMPVGDASIGYGINIPAGLLLSALMQKHSKDWSVQINVAESLVCHVVEKHIPYSLLPLDCAPMDSFMTNYGVVESEFERKYRPLQMTRASQNHAAFQEKADHMGDLKGGSTVYGVLEDTAHMQSVLSTASNLQYANYWEVDLQAWNFEIKWGGEGSVTPLRYYPNNQLLGGDELNQLFLAQEHQYAYVVVAEDNTLDMYVLDDGGGGSLKCGEMHCERSVQQKKIFGHKWGPALKFGRSGILLRGLVGEPLLTLVPYDQKTPEDMLKEGFAGIEFFRDGFYLARNGETGEDVKLLGREVEERIVRVGTYVGVAHAAPCMAPYRRSASQIYYGRSGGVEPQRGFQFAKLVIDDSTVPIFGAIPVIMQLKEKKARSSPRILRLNVEPEHIRLFSDQQLKGCHRYINIEGLRGVGER